MSNFWLCDLCAVPHWTTEDGHFVCERMPFATEKRVMHDRCDSPTDVCRGYEGRDDEMR